MGTPPSTMHTLPAPEEGLSPLAPALWPEEPSSCCLSPGRWPGHSLVLMCYPLVVSGSQLWPCPLTLTRLLLVRRPLLSHRAPRGPSLLLPGSLLQSPGWTAWQEACGVRCGLGAPSPGWPSHGCPASGHVPCGRRGSQRRSEWLLTQSRGRWVLRPLTPMLCCWE